MLNSIKKLALLVCVVLISSNVYAQVPQGFNFQAVARGTDGLPLVNENLGVQISVVKGTEAGDIVYTETHSVVSNPVGLIQLIIGDGTAAENSDFSAIDWSSDNYFVKLEIDPAGGTTYEDLGTTRLLSVPYALLAQKVVEGVAGQEGYDDLITIDTDDPNLQDSLKIIRLGSETVDEIANGVEIEGASTGRNRPLTATINELQANTASQYAISGTASGPGTGTHIGILGSAWNPTATGGTRYGVYGQANSLSKYNYGMNGVAVGSGNGDEGEGFGEGSINFGLYGYASGNKWSNTGLEARNAGEFGKVNYGVHGLSSAGSADSTKNYAIAGRASGPGLNYGVYGSAWNGVENYAGFFDGTVQINGNTTVTGQLVVDGNIEHSGSITQTSDGRLKKNIQTLNNALENTLKLRGVSYTWLDETKSQKNQIGVIAQEVEVVYPEFVRTDDDGMKSVNYAQMTAVLIEAVKELNKKIEALETENQTLQAQVDEIDTMKTELSKIWKVLEQNSVSSVTKTPNE